MTPVIDSDDDGAVLRAIGMVRGLIANDEEHVRAVMTAAIGNDDYKARMRTVGALVCVAVEAVRSVTHDQAEADRFLDLIQQRLVRGDPDSDPLESQ